MKPKVLAIAVELLATFTLYAVVNGQESPHKNLNLNCEVCHRATEWTDVRFNHDRTKFPLEERHRNVPCKSCHNIEDFSNVTSECASCHPDVHQAKMGNDCERCHGFKGWEVFNVEEIHANTQFPLMGKHTLVDCQSCHVNQQQGDFALLTSECVSCHQ
ncbi:MAG TPA: cytochrome c3 family protein, partial [bacterium]